MSQRDKTRQWSAPNLAGHRDDPAFAGVEIIVTRGPGKAAVWEDGIDGALISPAEEGPVLRERARCPKCRTVVSLHEIVLWWCADAGAVAARCSGCRTKTNRAKGGKSKADILADVGAPKWLRDWHDGERTKASDPGGSVGVVD